MARKKALTRQLEALKILWELRNRRTNEVEDPSVFLKNRGFGAPSILLRILKEKGFLTVDVEDRRGHLLHGGRVAVASFTESGIAEVGGLLPETPVDEVCGNGVRNECAAASGMFCVEDPSNSEDLRKVSPVSPITLSPVRGQGAFQKNLQMILCGLWDVAKDGVVGRPKQLLEKHISAPLRYLRALEDANCLEIIVSDGRGRAIQEVRLLKKSLPAAEPAEHIVSRRSETRTASSSFARHSGRSDNLYPENIAIFIDVPNLVSRGSLGFYNRIHWLPLIECIALKRRVKEIFGYVSIPARITNENVPNWPPAVAMHNAGIQVRWRLGSENGRRKADIDQMMSYDLGVFSCSPSDIGTLVLVSGDDDFSYAVRDIAKRTKINIEICCWEKYISKSSGFWTCANVRFLDDFSEKFLPVLA